MRLPRAVAVAAQVLHRIFFGQIQFRQLVVRLRRGSPARTARPVAPGVLVDKPALLVRVTSPGVLSSSTAQPAPMDVGAMTRALSAILDRRRDARDIFRHLAYLESKLKKMGPKVFTHAPVDVLRRALAQLDGVAHDREDPRLGALRSRLALALVDRSPVQEFAPAAQEWPSDFHIGDRLDVHEVSLSEFLVAANIALDEPAAQEQN